MARQRYKITENQYNELMQQKTCMICAKISDNKRNLCIDHSHETGKIRGILCHACNVGLGNFKDNINNLEKAIDYLKRVDK